MLSFIICLLLHFLSLLIFVHFLATSSILQANALFQWILYVNYPFPIISYFYNFVFFQATTNIS